MLEQDTEHSLCLVPSARGNWHLIQPFFYRDGLTSAKRYAPHAGEMTLMKGIQTCKRNELLFSLSLSYQLKENTSRDQKVSPSAPFNRDGRKYTMRVDRLSCS
jgi:hypothetical protein